MFVRLLFWINTLLILIKGNDGYVRTYADQHYGRIRGRNKSTGFDAGTIFLIVFGCIIGGFLVVCIFGTFIFGIFDNGFQCSRRSRTHRNISSNAILMHAPDH